MQRLGPKNGRWKGGISKSYIRRLTGCKPNDGRLVHHKRGYKNKNPKKRDFLVLNNRGCSSWAKHNRLHPEKGGYHPPKKR